MGEVHQLYTDSAYQNFNYFIELSNSEVAVVDPLITEQIVKWCQEHKKTLKVIIITHEHPDHIAAKDELKEMFSAQIWAHEECRGIVSGVDRYLQDKEEIKISHGVLEIMHTPGHTKTHICLLIKSEENEHQALIAMDTVFNAGVGHCKLGGDPKVLYQSIKRIAEYVSDEAILYPGHDYIEHNLAFTLDREPNNIRAQELMKMAKEVGGRYVETDLGMEKEINVFFRLDSKTIISNLPKEVTTEEEVFLSLRELRDNW